MSWEVITPPTDLPVSYSETKGHLRLDTDDERGLVIALTAAATAYGETYTQRSFTPRTLEVREEAGNWHRNSGWIGLPRGPVTEIISVTDADGNTIADDRYEIRRMGTCDYCRFITGGGNSPHVVRYVAGYDPTPPDLILALKMHVAHLFNSREAVAERPSYHVALGLQAIYDQYKAGLFVC